MKRKSVSSFSISRMQSSAQDYLDVISRNLRTGFYQDPNAASLMMEGAVYVLTQMGFAVYRPCESNEWKSVVAYVE